MNEERIDQAMENAIVKMIGSGDGFKIEYSDRINVADVFKKAYARINFDKVQKKITELLEVELATKIVNKIITEMGTDIKQMMSNATIRDDFKFMLRRGVTDILERVKEQP